MSASKTEDRRGGEEEMLVLRHPSSETRSQASSAALSAAYLPNPPVILGLGLLLQLLPGCHHLVIRKGYPVDPLQRLHFRVTLPICWGILNIRGDLGKHTKPLVTNKTALKHVQLVHTRGLSYRGLWYQPGILEPLPRGCQEMTVHNSSP